MKASVCRLDLTSAICAEAWGFRLITGVIGQLNGQFLVQANAPRGARFIVEMPILESADADGAAP